MSMYKLSALNLSTLYYDKYVLHNTVIIINLLPLNDDKKKIYIDMIIKYHNEYGYKNNSNINYNKFILDHINNYDKIDINGFLKLYYITDIIINNNK